MVAGVFSEGLFAGVVFVGPFWVGRSASPDAELVWRKKTSRLRPALTAVDALANELGRYLRETSTRPADRRQIILRFVQRHYGKPIGLNDLARDMNLSPSRMGHVVHEVCGMTFPALIAQTRLQEAARLLTSGDWPIGDIARQVGYDDQNYFSRSFRNTYAISPREYRKKYFTGI
jgi:AraC-like DNA-binding protein